MVEERSNNEGVVNQVVNKQEAIKAELEGFREFIVSKYGGKKKLSKVQSYVLEVYGDEIKRLLDMEWKITEITRAINAYYMEKYRKRLGLKEKDMKKLVGIIRSRERRNTSKGGDGSNVSGLSGGVVKKIKGSGVRDSRSEEGIGVSSEEVLNMIDSGLNPNYTRRSV